MVLWSTMAKQLYTYRQADVFPGRGGVCFCLTALWCRTMFEAPKDKWSSPTNDPTTRRDYLSSLPAKQWVAPHQGLFIAKVGRYRGNAERLDTARSVIRILNRSGHAVAAHEALAVLLPTADSILAAHDRNIRSTLEAFTVRVVASRTVAAWPLLPLKLQLNRAHVISFSTAAATGHAIGIYQTNGFFSSDFYVFNPNYGEFHCQGDSDLLLLMTRMMAQTLEYNNPTGCTVYELQPLDVQAI